MIGSKVLSIVSTACVPLPYQLLQTILFPKNLIHHQVEIIDLMIINADKNDAVFCEQLTCQKETWIHHRQPRRMVASTRFRITCLQIAFGINLLSQLEIGVQRICIVIGINEVATGIVWRVNVDGFDPTKIGLIEKLENLKVISLNKEVLGGVKMEGFVTAGL